MTEPANPKTSPGVQSSKAVGIETIVALIGTAFAALLMMLTTMYAGPMWRDETNTINMAKMSSLTEIWNNLSYESFPPLWVLIVRAFYFLGMAGSDAGIRVVGLYVGIFFLLALWLCSRWMGGRGPILSVALLGCLPMFIFIIGANRAYGLASALLVLSFGMIWQVVELPSKSRILWAGLVCVLFAQCIYYDVVFLAGMLGAGALVVIRRRQWKTLAALAGIGAAACGSMVIYLPVIHRGSAYVPMNQEPTFSLMTLWYKISDAASAHGSARLSIYHGLEIWLWVILLVVGIVVGLLTQLKRKLPEPGSKNTADLALYCGLSLLLGMAGYLAFLIKLRYLTEAWYYLEVLCLCAVCLDGLLGACWPALRPWGWLRMGIAVIVVLWFVGPAWEEAHTRRSNLDLVATVLNKNAQKGDLIIVQSSWEGITFDRYYSGPADWTTIPPVASHKLHRNDLAFGMMNNPAAMAPVLSEITSTLRASNTVWMVGPLFPYRPEQVAPSPTNLPAGQWVPHVIYWNTQVGTLLRDHALQTQNLELPAGQPVSRLENLPIQRFQGYKSLTTVTN